MQVKINQLIEDYTAKLERKQRKIEPLLEIKNSIDGFGSDIKSEIEYNRLDVEINTLKMIIEDLKWCLDENN